MIDELRAISIQRRRLPGGDRRAVAAWVDAEASRPGARVVVSTCERIEVYRDDGSLDPPMVAATSRVRTFGGDGAAHHLFRVAAGLDSRLIGETQVIGQLRSAVDGAHASGLLSPSLARLFRSALRAGGRARA